MAFACAYLGHE